MGFLGKKRSLHAMLSGSLSSTGLVEYSDNSILSAVNALIKLFDGVSSGIEVLLGELGEVFDNFPFVVVGAGLSLLADDFLGWASAFVADRTAVVVASIVGARCFSWHFHSSVFVFISWTQ